MDNSVQTGLGGHMPLNLLSKDNSSTLSKDKNSLNNCFNIPQKENVRKKVAILEGINKNQNKTNTRGESPYKSRRTDSHHDKFHVNKSHIVGPNQNNLLSKLRESCPQKSIDYVRDKTQTDKEQANISIFDETGKGLSISGAFLTDYFG